MILPINNQPNAQSFKGLWGRKHAEAAGSEYGSYAHETHHYHPFKDESESNINRMVNKRTESWTTESGGFRSSYYSTVRVMDTLPFTEKEYNDYKALKGSKLDESGKVVEDGLGKARLYKSMNNVFKYVGRKMYELLPKFIRK